MNVNMGTTDRVIRGIVGLVLIIVPFLTNWAVFSTEWVMYLSVIVGLVLGGTAIFGVCPLYNLMGMNTRNT